MLDFSGVSVSSRECRERVAAGLPLDYLVPPEVVDFIRTHRLYQGGDPG
jgi:nicotinate-nucleotide adenylyltransferase